MGGGGSLGTISAYVLFSHIGLRDGGGLLFRSRTLFLLQLLLLLLLLGSGLLDDELEVEDDKKHKTDHRRNGDLERPAVTVVPVGLEDLGAGVHLSEGEEPDEGVSDALVEPTEDPVVHQVGHHAEEGLDEQRDHNEQPQPRVTTGPGLGVSVVGHGDESSDPHHNHRKEGHDNVEAERTGAGTAHGLGETELAAVTLEDDGEGKEYCKGNDHDRTVDANHGLGVQVDPVVDVVLAGPGVDGDARLHRVLQRREVGVVAGVGCPDQVVVPVVIPSNVVPLHPVHRHPRRPTLHRRRRVEETQSLWLRHPADQVRVFRPEVVPPVLDEGSGVNVGVCTHHFSWCLGEAESKPTVGAFFLEKQAHGPLARDVLGNSPNVQPCNRLVVPDRHLPGIVKPPRVRTFVRRCKTEQTHKGQRFDRHFLN
eukprot:Hpha_TRINITY_DN15556_c1_g13::TRINITY_DN15556_c1_g13_i1::g.106942::m.106942